VLNATAGGGSSYVAGNNISISGSTLGVKTAYLGYQKSYFTSLSDFTNVGTVSTTISNGQVAITSGSGTYTQYLELINYPTDNENVEYEIIYQVTALNAGLGIGKKSFNGWTGNAISAFVQVNTTTNTCYIINPETPATLATYQLSYITAVNDVLKVRYQQQGNVLNAIVQNLTQNKYDTFQVINQLQYGNNTNLPNASYPTIWSMASGNTLVSMKTFSNTVTHPDVLFVGDSKTVGICAGDKSLRFSSLCGSLGLCQNYAGQSDRTAEILACLPEIIALKPKQVILCIGRNDIAAGVATATWQSNLSSIDSQLTAAGITVTHLVGLLETTPSTVSVTPLTTYCNATFTGRVIDCTSSFVVGTMLAADGVHSNQIGNAYIASQILASSLVTVQTYASANLNYTEFLAKNVANNNVVRTSALTGTYGPSAMLSPNTQIFNGYTIGGTFYALNAGYAGGIFFNTTNGSWLLQTSSATNTAGASWGGTTLMTVSATGAVTFAGSGTFVGGINNTNGSCTIDVGTGLTMSIASGSNPSVTLIGANNAAIKNVTIGSTNTTSFVTLNAGTGGITLNGTVNGLTVTGITTINVGSGNTLGLSVDANPSVINIATGAAVKNVTIGSTNTSSFTTINSGTGGFTVYCGGTYNISLSQYGTFSTPGFNATSTGILTVNKLLQLAQAATLTATATFNIDLSTGNLQQITLSANITTFTVTNPYITKYVLKFTQDATGSRTVAFPSGWRWPGGSAPTLTATANKTDIIELYYDGTTYYANRVVANA